MSRVAAARPITDNDDGTLSVALTRGKVAKIEGADLSLLGLLLWGALPIVRRNGRRTGQYYAVSKRRDATGKQRIVYMHRLIMGVTDRRVQVDHINHDTLDNRRCNLRLVTNQQNSANARHIVGKSSAFKGVTWHKAAAKWAGYIRVDYKTLYLGLFDEEVEAAMAYDAAAILHFGMHALVNFPELGSEK